ncbi:MAG TPA: F0F1 ATP synthase subunit gamma [Candidatus Saccharimonadales bacterium]|nr:F0F1 ATP synthase subunit gamma [Candidatus Saccharimonadales bacterium]
MNYLKAIVAQMEDLGGIKDIVGASEEIASMKMRSIRNKVLLSRDVNDELTEIYREVSISYKNQILLLLQEKKAHNKLTKGEAETLSLKTGNGKFACVYLSANSGLFSKILEKTYREFIAYLDQHPDAVPVIIGEFGKKLFTNNYPNRQFTFYPLAEGKGIEDSLKKVTEDLAQYSNVIIYYARFESMAHQTTTVLDVSGQGKKDVVDVQTAHYLFEPSLEKIIAFFESEIFAGIIQQTVTESELARYASRITTLDMARENINQQLKIANLEKRFAVHRMMNKKQTEAITGISLWKIT